MLEQWFEKTHRTFRFAVEKSQFTNRTCSLAWFMVVKSLPNPAWYNESSFVLPTSSFWSHTSTILHAPQTKSLNVEKYSAKTFCNHFHTPNYSIWAKSASKVLTNGPTHLFFDEHFSRASVLNLGHKLLKSASKIRISHFVTPSKIFVWEG